MTKAKRRLAIVGASARAAAFSALRAGYEVVAADLFGDADLARVADVTRIENYPEGFADWLAEAECDAWMYTGALENSPELVDRMAAIRPLVGNLGASLRNVRDPLKLQAALVKAGVPFPETRANADGLPLDGSWLCKTYRGASGSGVWVLDGAEALDGALRHRAVFQRRVAGKPAAAIFAQNSAAMVLWGVTRQLLDDDAGHPWRYRGSLGPIAVNSLTAEKLAVLGGVLSNRFEMRGVVGVDLLLTAEGPQVVEVNPRYTASVEILERWLGNSVMAEIGGVLAGPGDGSARWGRERESGFFAKSIFYARRDAIVSAPFFEWAMSQSSLDVAKCHLADIPAAGEVVPAGRPVLTVLASGQSEADCEHDLDERLAEVERRLYDR